MRSATGWQGKIKSGLRSLDIAGRVPVLAAGGVVTGRHLAASLALGAQGVWTGSIWLVAEEYGLNPKILRKLLAATVSNF